MSPGRQPTRRQVERRIDDLGGDVGDDEKYREWYGKFALAALDPKYRREHIAGEPERPPDGLDEWLQSPAGQAWLAEATEALRAARDVDLSEHLRDPSAGD